MTGLRDASRCLLGLLMAVLALGGMVGCGGGDDASVTTTAAATVAAVEDEPPSVDRAKSRCVHDVRRETLTMVAVARSNASSRVTVPARLVVEVVGKAPTPIEGPEWTYTLEPGMTARSTAKRNAALGDWVESCSIVLGEQDPVSIAVKHSTTRAVAQRLAATPVKPPPRPSAPSKSDAEIIAARDFYLATDDDAVTLDELIWDVQNGDGGAIARIRALRAKIEQRANDYVLKTGEMSVGANLLMSAATSAVEAARSGDLHGLAQTHNDIADAREKLAETVFQR